MTSDVTLTAASTDAQKTGQQSLKLAQDFDEFLNLLTTQLQNQDPLNPMDSKEFTNQIVQFSQVEQAINTNQKLDNLVSLQLSTIASSALDYVGMDASYLSAEMSFDGQTPIDITYALAEEAVESKVNIYDETGQLVYSSVAPSSTGQNKFKWNGEVTGGGTAEPGTYSIEIAAFNGEGEQIDTSTVVSGRVRGIETQNGVVFLLIGERAVPVSNVINATQPPVQDASAPADDGGDTGDTETDGGTEDAA